MKVNSAISSEKPLYFSIIALLGRHVSFSSLHQMENKKGKEEDGGWAPTVRETGWHNMLVIVMSLLQYISHCGRAPSSRLIACLHASIGADNLIPSRSIFRG